jgi:hypothetical protein
MARGQDKKSAKKGIREFDRILYFFLGQQN